jgi:hypothetical protein
MEWTQITHRPNYKNYRFNRRSKKFFNYGQVKIKNVTPDNVIKLLDFVQRTRLEHKFKLHDDPF